MIPGVLWHTINMKNETASVTTLSPSTQAVSDAVKQVYWDWGNLCPADAHTIAAAALRAAADQVVPICSRPSHADDFEHGDWFARGDVRADLLAIADEMEGR